jgi:large subunit ribosomal protein L13
LEEVGLAATVQRQSTVESTPSERRVSGEADLHNTYSPRPRDLDDEWFVIDCAGRKPGRVYTKVSMLLQGKGRPGWAPHADMRVFVILTNVDAFVLPSRPRLRHRHSGYPGGLRTTELRDDLASDPLRAVRRSIWGMLPKNRRGRMLLGRVKVYAGPNHPHQAQRPVPLEVPQAQVRPRTVRTERPVSRPEPAVSEPKPGVHLRVVRSDDGGDGLQEPAPSVVVDTGTLAGPALLVSPAEMAARFRRWGEEVIDDMTVIPLGSDGELGTRVEVDAPDGAILNAYASDGVVTLSWSTSLTASEAFEELYRSLLRRGIHGSYYLGEDGSIDDLRVEQGKDVSRLLKHVDLVVTSDTLLVRLELEHETWVWQARVQRQSDEGWTSTFGVRTSTPDAEAIFELHQATRERTLRPFADRLRAALGLTA